MPRFVIQSGHSLLTARGSSTLHGYAAAAPVSGHIDAEIAGGELALDPVPSGRLEIDVRQLHGPDRRYDREFRNRLDVQRYPRIVGVLREFSRTGNGTYRMTGDLTVRGVSQLVEGTMRTEIDDDGALRGAGEATVDLRRFGLDPPRFLFLRVDPHIAVQVDFVAARET